MNRLRAGIALHNAGRYLAASDLLGESRMGNCVTGASRASAATHEAREEARSSALERAEHASECEEPPDLEFDGDAIDVHDLAGEEIVLAVKAVIDADGDGLLESSLPCIERDATGEDGRTPIVTIALDYLEDPTPIVEQRLREHCQRREMRASDVDGLF